MIHTPNLTALRYEGDEPQRFKHLMGVRSFPMLSKGDIILVPSLTAHQLRKKTEFVVVDLNEVLGANVIIVSPADEGTTDEGKAPADEGTTDEGKAPADEGTTDEGKAPADEGTTDEGKAPADEGTTDEGKAPEKTPKVPKPPKPLGKH